MTDPFTISAPPREAAPGPIDGEFGASPLPDPAGVAPSSSRLGRRLLWVLVGLLAVAVAVDLVSLGYQAVTQPTAGTIAWGLVYLAAVVWLAVLITRQVAALLRLETVGDLHARADAVLAGSPAGSLFDDLDRLYAGRADTAWSHAHFAETRGEAADDADRLGLFEDLVLAPLDTRATAAILKSARRSAVFTAISPFVALDVAVTLWRAVVMLRDIAEVYGARAGGMAAVSLLRRVIGQLALAGGLEATHEMMTELLGGGITARLSTRVGQGVVNGLFMIRLGLAAMEACRPCSFGRVAKPTVLDLGRRALAPLRETPAA